MLRDLFYLAHSIWYILLILAFLGIISRHRNKF